MPTVNTRDLVACLIRKLAARELEGDHRVFEVFDDEGTLVARTKVSRSWRGTTAIGSGMVSIIARQLGLTSGQLLRLVSCEISREEYLAIASLR